MAIGRSNVQPRFEDPRSVLVERLRGTYRLLAEHGGAMFADDYFADPSKSSELGRPTITARVLATVMLLQSHEGLSDQEACDHLVCDLRWQAACGVDVGAASFHPTTLAGLRNRPWGSARPLRLSGTPNRRQPRQACDLRVISEGSQWVTRMPKAPPLVSGE